MTKYVQINQAGYVMGIVDEPLLVGLFGGTRSIEVSDSEAGVIQKLLEAHHRSVNGLYIHDLVEFKQIRK